MLSNSRLEAQTKLAFETPVGVAMLDALPAAPNVALGSAVAAELQSVRPERTSHVLRGILANNPGVRVFSVERILAAIGHDRLEASLMVFSLPAVIPIPVPRGAVAIPTSALAYQLVSGERQIRLPRFVLEKSITRRALAVAIHAILPVLEAAEKIARPRWLWVSHSSSRRAIGLFVFLLAVALAFPLFGFSALHATSIFVLALGMAEQDGLAVLIGVVIGVLSLAVVAASGASARALRGKAGRWLRKLGRRLGLQAFASFLRRRGYEKLARLLTFEWSRVLLLWDPEKGAARRVPPARPGQRPAAGRARPSRPLPPTAPGAGVAAARPPMHAAPAT